ncbi:hypothetical protein [Micromonospora sp. NPDC047740]|uniref:hypothetical protein n=1 Tax=Micromonospora sp. NPDC047740 TaxID=3364254 RepID=UPI0037105B8E
MLTKQAAYMSDTGSAGIVTTGSIRDGRPAGTRMNRGQSMKTRTAKSLAAAFVALTAAVVAVPGQAQAAPLADPHYWMYTDDDNPGGRVDFWPNGDIVQLCDLQADGARAELNIYDATAGGVFKYHLEASGNGSCSTGRASLGAPFDLAEGHCFRFNISLTDNGQVVNPSFDQAHWRNYNDATANCG